MHHAHWDGRVLAVYAQSKGIAYAVFEGPQSPVDWGVKGLKGDRKNIKGLKVVEALVMQFQPDAIVIEDSAGKGSRRSERIRRLYRSIESLAGSQIIEVHRYSRAQLRQCFDEGFGAGVETRRRFIKHKNRCVFENSTCNSDTLTLAARDHGPILAHHTVQPE